MKQFAQPIHDYWQRVLGSGELVRDDAAFTLAVNPESDAKRSAMVLEYLSGNARAVVTPAIADKADMVRNPPETVVAFRRRLADAGVELNTPDHLYYLPEDEFRTLGRDYRHPVRSLTREDAEIFAEFQAQASEQDLEDSYVELDHWLVSGAFDNGQLAGAASMYPWGNAKIADMGVLTLSAHRGKGIARDLVRSISVNSLYRGYHPQYRCQHDNAASVALATSAGFAALGTWQVIALD